MGHGGETNTSGSTHHVEHCESYIFSSARVNTDQRSDHRLLQVLNKRSQNMQAMQHCPPMPLTNNPPDSTAVKDIVRSGYDVMADKYLDFATSIPTYRLEWINRLIKTIPPASPILELGCGGGLPITKYLLDRGFTVTANDISQTQIDIAQRKVPGAHYIVGDMASLNLSQSTFNGVVMFFSLFHLPLNEQQDVLNQIHLWLKPGGHLVLSVGAGNEPEKNGEFMGRPMFWADAGKEGTRKMIEEAGLEIVESEVRKEEDVEGMKNPDEGMSFLWVLARKK